MRRESFTRRAREHGLLAADHDRKEIRRPPDRRGTVLGTSLAEIGKILGEGEIAGHADFLPPPMRIPFTRQMTGLSHPRMLETMSLNNRMYCRYSWGLPA